MPDPGRRVLLLHGGGLAAWMWRPVTDALPNDLLVHAPDLPGHGSRSLEDYPGHQASSAELADWCTAGEPPVVVGFSLGAQLALTLAARGLAAATAVISARVLPSATDLGIGIAAGGWGLTRHDWFNRAQARAMGVPQSLVEDYLRDVLRLRRTTLATVLHANADFRTPPGWATAVGQRLIAVGAEEPRVTRRSAVALHQGSPGSSLEIVPGHGHDLCFQADWMVALIGRLARA